MVHYKNETLFRKENCIFLFQRPDIRSRSKNLFIHLQADYISLTLNSSRKKLFLNPSPCTGPLSRGLSLLSREPPSRLRNVSGLSELIWSELAPAPGTSFSGFNGAEGDSSLSSGSRVMSKMRDEECIIIHYTRSAKIILGQTSQNPRD